MKDLLKYFHDPDGLAFKCRWCYHVYKGGHTSYWNLWGHRDGNATRPACKQRHRAILAGVVLPPSYSDKQLAQKKDKNDLKSFLKGPSFSADLLNMILVMWIVRQALPWARFEDPTLRAAFYMVNRGAVVRSRTWAAQQAVILHSALHSKAINAVKENIGKFCLIHEVWTTKGNRYAFIGASANYVDNNWNYVSTHLTLKMVAWRHFGALLARPVGRFLTRHGLHKKMLAQTTDSGGNNGPMATELQSMFAKDKDPVTWDGSTHHVRCYAHKLNLVVGHGLKALGQKMKKTMWVYLKRPMV